uniref:Uncharacterized protein LOC100176143 n=1 Tax=Phallusia mammillata TaxID=59560 RepID=A0A6F9DH53_9ASCI|nr:uncharacterized protein LOC100176143 [Phallusia mammillata]
MILTEIVHCSDDTHYVCKKRLFSRVAFLLRFVFVSRFGVSRLILNRTRSIKATSLHIGDRRLQDTFYLASKMTNEENAVSIKLPTFWAEQPRIWFQQTEAQFALKKITCDQTKYYYQQNF